jgi:hypothetical protein
VKVYYLEANSDDYNYLTLRNDNDWGKFDLFDGRSLINDWAPFDVKVVKGKKRKWGDVAILSAGVLAITEKSKVALENLIKDSVELLPLTFEGQSFYILNVVNMVDGLDKQKSEYDTFDDGRIMHVTKYEFKPEIVRGHHIFKIPEFERGRIYVSDEFKKVVDENNLIGYDLDELWNSEE